MNQPERMDYLIRSYQELNPGEVVTSDTKINNTPIWKLAQSDGGPYQRVSKWIEEKLREKAESALALDQAALDHSPTTSDLFRNIMDECFQVMAGRNEKYGESWRVMNVPSIANLCEMKLNRISAMDKLNPKVEDELIDVLNYMVFAIIKYRNL